MYKQYFRIIKLALVLSIALHSLILSTPSHAQSISTPIPASFEQHYIYQPILPLSSSVETRLGWDVNVLFVDDQIEAEWIVRVEQKPAGGEWQVTDDFVREIGCAARSDSGNGPNIEDGVAYFDAVKGDYFVCDIPSFEDAATQLIDAFLDSTSYFYTQNLNNNPTISGAVLKQTERNRKIGKRKPPTTLTRHNYKINKPIFSALYHTLIDAEDFVCTGCVDFWGAAEFNWLPSSSGDSAPLLHLADASDSETFFTYELHTTLNLITPQIRTSGLSEPVVGPSTEAISAQHLSWSGLNPQRFYNAIDARYNSTENESMSKYWSGLWLPTALVSGLIAEGEQLDVWFSGVENVFEIEIFKQDTAEYDFSADPLTLYVGYNPSEGTYFNGSMTQAGVDPGCTPH